MDAASAQGRFGKSTEIDITKVLEDRNSTNTKQSTKVALLCLQEYALSLNKGVNFDSYSQEELADLLTSFYVDARKKDGTKYKLSSLKAIRFGLARHFSQELDFDIIKSPLFKKANDVFSAMKVQLKREGLGKIDHTPALEVDELQQIYSSVAMNTETPVGLQNKVWFDVMFYLCRRGRENLRQMTKSTVQIAVGNKGLEYVYQYRDEMDKNHREDDTEGNTTEGRMYAVLGNPLCPVTSFKKYLSKLHPSRDDLWQKPRDTYNEDSSTWYCNAPLGKNTLSNMMKNICKYAELPKEYNNHSIRATSISILDSQFASRDIMKISGHKSETSIKSYSAKTTDKNKQDMSNFLLNSLQDCSTVLDENTGLAASIEEEIFIDQNQIDELLKPMENENSTHSEINDSNSEVSVQILQPIENKKVNENNHSNKQISMQMISKSNQEIRNNVVVPQLENILGSTFTPYITGCVVNFNVTLNK